MATYAFHQADVFASDPFSGNPVAVVHGADPLSTTDMERLTRWTNLSEATFLLAPTDPAADYRVRIFAPGGELPFAGHPTLGSCAAWLEAGGRPRRGDVIVQECGVGLVTLRCDDDAVSFAAPPLLRDGPVDGAELRAALQVLGIDRDAVVDAHWVDNGPGWMGIRLRDADAVLAVDTPSVRRHDFFVGVVGLHGAGAECAVEIRGFFSGADGSIREDPVTGSLNASVAQWLLADGTLTAPYVAAQGTALGGRGRVSVDLIDGQVWVGGRTHLRIAGSITI